MSTNGLKSSKMHPYQLRVVPFWRNNESGSLMTYSDDTKDNLERFKFDFENNCKYIQWEVKPQILLRGEHLERILESKLKNRI